MMFNAYFCVESCYCQGNKQDNYVLAVNIIHFSLFLFSFATVMPNKRILIFSLPAVDDKMHYGRGFFFLRISLFPIFIYLTYVKRNVTGNLFVFTQRFI